MTLLSNETTTPATLTPIGPWIAQAACARAGEHRPAFITEKPTAASVAAAAGICDRCPVFADCAAYDATARPTFGMWAGRWRGKPKPAATPAAG